MDKFRRNTLFTVVFLMVMIVLHNHSPIITKVGIMYACALYAAYACHIESLIIVGYFDEGNTGNKTEEKTDGKKAT